MFVEVNWNGLFYQNLAIPASSGSWTKYEVKYSSNPENLQFFADDVYKDGKVISGTLVPNEAQQFAELHERANQVPGGVNNHSQFTGSFYKLSTGVTNYFDDPPAQIVDTPNVTWAEHQLVSLAQVDIWDTACQN